MSALDELKKEIMSDPILKKSHEAENQLYYLAILLKKIRIQKNYTQKDIAMRAGLTQQMISKIESYNGNPSLSSFTKYCNGIGVNLLELIKNSTSNQHI